MLVDVTAGHLVRSSRTLILVPGGLLSGPLGEDLVRLEHTPQAGLSDLEPKRGIKIMKMHTAPVPAIPDVLEDPIRDKGTAFTESERDALGLTGRLPSAVLTLDQQAQRAYQQMLRQGDDLAKNVNMEQLHDRNEVLYYRVLADHLAELLPVVYDPVIGDAIEQYSHEYRRPRGLYLSMDRPDDMDKAFDSLGLRPEDVDLIVCSDAEEILGTGY